MNDDTVQGLLAELVRWGVPALIVFGAAALVAVAAVVVARRARRGPRARAAAERERAAAGGSLVALDDAVEELDLEIALSGALYDGSAPATLRRMRMAAQHARDEAFARLRDLPADAPPPELHRLSADVRARADAAFAQIGVARTQHADWMREHRAAGDQVEEVRERLEALRAELGDPKALVAELAERVDPAELEPARRAAAEAAAALAEADRHVADAAARAGDPRRAALPALAAAERAVRRGQRAARALEEHHRLVVDASRAVREEIELARTALRQADALRSDGQRRDELDAAAAERLGEELRAFEAALTATERDAERRPTWTVAEVARIRDRLDLALGDARTAQQRVRGARTALPGTIAAARAAVARAEVVAAKGSADARMRLSSAHAELAAARSAQDPVAALDAARRALRHADDAVALADYDRMTGH